MVGRSFENEIEIRADIMLRISHARYLNIYGYHFRVFNVFFHRITLVLLNPQLFIFENTVDPEQLASDGGKYKKNIYSAGKGLSNMPILGSI